MKIQYLSDLHFDFGSEFLLENIKKSDSDVIIIAGDLTTAKQLSIIQIIQHQLGSHIVMVPGNHEYYYGTKAAVDQTFNSFNKCL